MGSIPADTGLPGDVAEGAVTVVVVKHVLTPISDEQVLKPVVIVIADANTGRPAGTKLLAETARLARQLKVEHLVGLLGSALSCSLSSVYRWGSNMC
jgi:hypothetical protein